MTIYAADVQTPPPMITELPNEIIELILWNCRQADIFHLLLTCWKLYGCCLNQLYNTIIFDSSHRHFNKETNRCNSTYVRTVGGLKTCLRSLDRDSNKAYLVRRLECYNSLEIPDLEINYFFGKIFNKMINLKALRWESSPEITVDMLQKIHNPLMIDELCLDMALRNDWVSQQIPFLNFENLTYLSIRPFLNNKNLSLISQMISHVSTKQLRSLNLGRNLHTNHEVGSGFTFGAINIHEREEEDSTLAVLFDDIYEPFPNLENLSLEGINVRKQDYELLNHYIPLKKLTSLSLVGKQTMDGDSESFLLSLIPYLTNIRSIKIDWIETPRGDILSNVPKFLQDLKPNNLESLDIVVRGPTQLSYEYVLAIQHHRQSLKHLVIRTPGNKPNQEIEHCIQNYCPQLISLALPFSRHYDYLKTLTKLKFLQLTKTKAKPYLGQPTTYLLEDTTRLLSIVKLAGEIQPSIKFIKIENYVFQLKKTKPIIRDGLNQWFDKMCV